MTYENNDNTNNKQLTPQDHDDESIQNEDLLHIKNCSDPELVGSSNNIQLEPVNRDNNINQPCGNTGVMQQPDMII